jgi:hypothetical protein
MGGNALSHISVRLTQKNYQRTATECVGKLRALYPNGRVDDIPSYRAKADFGDLDILVADENFDPEIAAAALDPTEVVRNGPTTSLGIRVRPEVPHLDGNVFQVDLVSSPPEAYDYALAYFSFNDLGNLVGRTAHRAGLAHCHDGLYYYVRDGDYKFRNICLTQDYDTALAFLGYDPARFHAGFDTLTDIFEYVAGSAFFNRDIFLLENRNYQSRIRDRKRKTYTEFLKWCEARPDLPAFQYPDDKSGWLPRIAEHFPHFALEHAQALSDLAKQRAVKGRFNGQYVGALTGLAGKELGILMKHVKESFGSPEALHDFVLAASDAELAERIAAVRATLSL